MGSEMGSRASIMHPPTLPPLPPRDNPVHHAGNKTEETNRPNPARVAALLANKPAIDPLRS